MEHGVLGDVDAHEVVMPDGARDGGEKVRFLAGMVRVEEGDPAAGVDEEVGGVGGEEVRGLEVDAVEVADDHVVDERHLRCSFGEVVADCIGFAGGGDYERERPVGPGFGSCGRHDEVGEQGAVGRMVMVRR